MKTSKSIMCTRLSWAMSFCLCLCGQAAMGAENFVFKDGKVWVVNERDTVPLEADVELPGSILVSTNGTFTVGTHSPRAFAEGQSLGEDGMLTSPNGRLEPVIDHVALDAGKTLFSVNGESASVGEIQLGTDKRLTWQRELIGGERGWMRVIDGL